MMPVCWHIVVWKVVRSCHFMNWRLWWKQESCMRDTAEKSAGTVNGAASVIKDDQEELSDTVREAEVVIRPLFWLIMRIAVQ